MAIETLSPRNAPGDPSIECIPVVRRAEVASNPRENHLSDEDTVVADKIWSLIEGINGFASSYEDGGYYSGVCPDMGTVRQLGEMAIELLHELKFGKAVSHG